MGTWRTTLGFMFILSISWAGCADSGAAGGAPETGLGDAEPAETSGMDLVAEVGGDGTSDAETDLPADLTTGSWPAPAFQRYCEGRDWEETLSPVTVGALFGDYVGVYDQFPAGTLETMKIIPAHATRVTGIRVAFAGSGWVKIRLMGTFGRSYPAGWPDIDAIGANLMDPVDVQVTDADPDEWLTLDLTDREIYLEPEQHYVIVFQHVGATPSLAVESLSEEPSWSRALILVPGQFEPYGVDGNFRMELLGESFCPWSDGERWFGEAAGAPFTTGAADRPAVADVDGDGHDDLLAVRAGLPTLFLGDGAGGFVEAAGRFPEGLQANMLATADLDNDGDEDCVAPTWASPPGEGEEAGQANRVLLNDGGFFTALEDAGIESLDPTGAAGLGDGNGDGILDLYLGNWLVQYPESPAYHDRYFLGVGDGTFFDVTTEAGLVPPWARPCYGVTWTDYDNDGLQDIWVGNYQLNANSLWRNNGDGTFEDAAPGAGLDHDDTGTWAGHTYGGDWGDVDNDGDLDLFEPNLAHPRTMPDSDPSRLMINQGPPSWAFEDRAPALGIPYDEGDVNAAFGDWDNDGDLDLVVAALYPGHFSKLFRNDGEGGFTDVTYETGTAVHDATAAVWVDADEDGDLDLIVGDRHGDQHLQLFLNRTGQDRPWVELLLDGDGSNRSAVGARVTVQAGGVSRIREVKAGGRHSSAQGTRWVHVGLGDAQAVDGVTVRWPGGAEETFSGVTPRARYRLLEGAGDAIPVP
ncbi:MAG: CRTAC1 family protein [Pseudomonadota bacterium]